MFFLSCKPLSKNSSFLTFILKGQITDVYFLKISNSKSYLSSPKGQQVWKTCLFVKGKLYLSSLSSTSEQETLRAAQYHSPSRYNRWKDFTTENRLCQPMSTAMWVIRQKVNGGEGVASADFSMGELPLLPRETSRTPGGAQLCDEWTGEGNHATPSSKYW